MEYQKMTNLLGNTSDKVPRVITNKWIEVHYQSGGGANNIRDKKIQALSS